MFTIRRISNSTVAVLAAVLLTQTFFTAAAQEKKGPPATRADNVTETYTVNASSEVANGTWKLRVQDQAALDTGYINSWKLTFP